MRRCRDEAHDRRRRRRRRRRRWSSGPWAPRPRPRAASARTAPSPGRSSPCSPEGHYPAGTGTATTSASTSSTATSPTSASTTTTSVGPMSLRPVVDLRPADAFYCSWGEWTSDERSGVRPNQGTHGHTARHFHAHCGELPPELRQAHAAAAGARRSSAAADRGRAAPVLLRTTSWVGIRSRISATWLTTPTTRPPSRSESRVSMTSSRCRRPATRSPRRRTACRGRRRRPPHLVTTSASPRASASDTTNVSPPDSVAGSRDSLTSRRAPAGSGPARLARRLVDRCARGVAPVAHRGETDVRCVDHLSEPVAQDGQRRQPDLQPVVSRLAPSTNADRCVARSSSA